LETYTNIEGAPTFLKFESHEDDKKVKLPPFLKILRDVTIDANFKTYNMA
jgi:hypothetical protein